MIGQHTGLAALACLVLVAPVRAQGVEQRLCQREADADRAYIAHDRAFLEALFADEFEHTNYKGGLANRADEIAFFTSPDFSMQSAAIDSCAVHAYHDVAVVTGINTWTGALFKGADLSGSYRFTRVYVKRKKRWQVVASQFSRIGTGA